MQVDRICTGREVTGNDIKIFAEPHVGEVRHTTELTAKDTKIKPDTTLKNTIQVYVINVETTTCGTS